ncbi:hypothetical protein SKAU_G00201200 [Synaphobranchus kaupii]|uniref:Uncharacterized protein n=1 Tax=Synaphobranchus kaupii TaxID=118154 RepID=A0A9Q1IXV9_SYNKA|nr:hypothetical protein SKAU_G00201200 [Synaphobranchus kaupii]
MSERRLGRRHRIERERSPTEPMYPPPIVCLNESYPGPPAPLSRAEQDQRVQSSVQPSVEPQRGALVPAGRRGEVARRLQVHKGPSLSQRGTWRRGRCPSPRRLHPNSPYRPRLGEHVKQKTYCALSLSHVASYLHSTRGEMFCASTAAAVRLCTSL